MHLPCLSYRLIPALLLLCLSPAIPSAWAQEQALGPAHTHGWLDANVPEVYKKWLNEDVRWIITHEECEDFKKLLGDKQRDAFVVAFWEHRNPTPGTPQNRFKEEHYRRLAYANTNFAEGVPGWRTDRGRIYVVYGPPDKVEHYPRKEPMEPQVPNGPVNSGYAYEVWRYQHMQGIGENISLEFVDTCGCGEYWLNVDPSEKDLQDLVIIQKTK